MRYTARLILCTSAIVATSIAPAQAQGMGDLLRGLIAASTRSSEVSAAKQRERDELLSQVFTSIQRTPDDACTLPRKDIERWAEAGVAQGNLFSTVRTSVFNESASGSAKLTGLDAITEQIRQDTAQRYANAHAYYAGGQVPVGEGAIAAAPEYSVKTTNIKATDRIDNGLKCSARVDISSSVVGTSAGFWFPVTYTIVLAPNDAAGWSGDFIARPESFSEEFALAHPEMIKIRFHGEDVSLAEARAVSKQMRARAAAEQAEQERQKAAKAAYQNSPAGRAQAAANNRALSVDYRRRGLACENNGGTWGVKWDATTVVRVPPGEVPVELARMSIGCYHL